MTMQPAAPLSGHSESDRSELPAMPGGELRAALVELIATSTRDAYWCTRVWDAWRVGTMSEDDFAPVEESEFPGELADSILALLVPAAAQVSAPADLAKHQSCGCVVCTCEDAEQCHGCGAKNCGKHPIGQFASPLYAAPVSAAVAAPAVTRKPLTDEQIDEVQKQWIAQGMSGPRAFARAIEAALATPALPLTEAQITVFYEGAVADPRTASFNAYNWFVSGVAIAELAHDIVATPAQQDGEQR